ncbi:MAG: 8-amino-7-oxononanoate synthase [Candidatus Omnitrophica bacterium]|nr:8-amino-7-oxononanoate synthase [Candidatus Omnitrophota bacterium]
MDRIDEFLKERNTKNLLRVLRPARQRNEGLIYFKDKRYIDFSSNDYLGLSNHPKLKEASKKATYEFGTSSSASRLLSGSLELHKRLEDKTAAFKKKEKALVFNSGYQANLGIISSLFGKDDVIFTDRLSHASIIDGILLSKSRFFRFKHNDMGHLEGLLKRERRRYKESLIVTETIFSMDGDRAPLRELVRLKKRYDCKLMVDEAHATGIFGRNGSGVVEEEGLAEEIDLIMGTFSKALGSFGAYLASSKKMVDYLVNSCRSFIYSTALPPGVIAANLAGLELIKEEPFRRRTLLENAGYFRKGLEKCGFETKGSSQTIPLIIGEAKKTIALGERLQERGYWALPIRPPTVPAGESRLRFSLNYNHTKGILKKFLDDISEAKSV